MNALQLKACAQDVGPKYGQNLSTPIEEILIQEIETMQMFEEVIFI